MAKSRKRKRDDVLGLDGYFTGIAFLSGKRSKDPKTQVGACIVNKHDRICGIGYNGMPDGCSDKALSSNRDDKQSFVCNAAMNAVLNKNSEDLRGCTIYTSQFPCNECAKVIIQAGINEVIYCSETKKGQAKQNAAEKMFDTAKVKYREFDDPLLVKIMKVDDNESILSDDEDASTRDDKEFSSNDDGDPSSSDDERSKKRHHKKQQRSKQQSKNDSDEEDPCSSDDSKRGKKKSQNKKRKSKK